jgi:hypothetical protein
VIVAYGCEDCYARFNGKRLLEMELRRRIPVAEPIRTKPATHVTGFLFG